MIKAVSGLFRQTKKQTDNCITKPGKITPPTHTHTHTHTHTYTHTHTHTHTHTPFSHYCLLNIKIALPVLIDPHCKVWDF